MASNAGQQIDNVIRGEQEFDYCDMFTDGAIGLSCGILGGKGASYGNSKGIWNAGKQLFKKGLFNPKARAYYAKVAHRMGGVFVFKPLLESRGYSAGGAFLSGIKNSIMDAID